MQDLEANNKEYRRALRERNVGLNWEGHSYLGIAF
jgi:hypothetical protein